MLRISSKEVELDPVPPTGRRRVDIAPEFGQRHLNSVNNASLFPSPGASRHPLPEGEGTLGRVRRYATPELWAILPSTMVSTERIFLMSASGTAK